MSKVLERRLLRSELVNGQAGGDWAKVGRGRHLEPGVVTYDNGDGTKITYLLTREAIAKGRKTAVGKPIIGAAGGFDHLKVNPEDAAAGKYDGEAIESYWGDDGWEWLHFIIRNEATKRKAKGGYQFSCAYVPTKVDETPGKWHNVDYDAVIQDLEYTHFAIVPNPRYDGAHIELQNAQPTPGGLLKKPILSLIAALVPLADLKECVNSMEADEKKKADEAKAAEEKKNAEDAEKAEKEKREAEKAEKRASAQNAYDAAMKNASSDEDREKAKAAFEKANAEIDAPASAEPTSQAPKQPLGGGDVTPEPGVPGQDGKVGTAATGAAANAKPEGETPEQAQEREKKALEAKNAEDEKAKKEAEEKAALEKKNADEAAAKEKEQAEAKKKEEERQNALKAKEAAEAAAKAAREEVLRQERFNSLKALAEERGAGDGLAPVGIVTVQDKENLGRARYGSAS